MNIINKSCSVLLGVFFAGTSMNFCFISSSFAATSKICIKKSTGELSLRTSCKNGFIPATLTNINKTSADSITTINSAITALQTADTSLIESFNSRYETLPSGKTIKGAIGFDVESASPSGDFRSIVSLPSIPSTPLESADVIVAPITGVTCSSVNCVHPNDSSVNSVCTGSVTSPTAPAGKLCIYIMGLSSSSIAGGTVQGVSYFAGRGFALAAEADSTGDLFINGSWAYTAP